MGYSFFYVFDIFYSSHKSKQLKREERQKKREEISQKNKALSATESEEPDSEYKNLTGQEIEKIREITQRAQINASRGYYETAKNLIVEGLAIDKDNRDLNIELAKVYELEEKFNNAEFIYKDMLEVTPDNVEILKRLWNVLLLQWKLEEALIPYELAFEKKKDEETVDVLAGVYFEIKNYKKSLIYTKLYLKDYPKNVEKLGMKWYALEKEWKTQEAIESYKKILQMQPYNLEIKERIAKLEEK